MHSDQPYQRDDGPHWGRLLIGLAIGAVAGFALANSGLFMLGGLLGLFAAFASRAPSASRHLVDVGAFVRDAYLDDDVDAETYERLADRLRARGFWMATAIDLRPATTRLASTPVATTAVAAPPSSRHPAPPTVAPPRPPEPVEDRPEVTPPSSPRPPVAATPPTAGPIPEPTPKVAPRRVPAFLGELSEPVRAFWRALAGDFAVQGLGSLGVLLVFTATLGFVFFAFTSVGVEYRPVAEVVVPVVLFGMAAFLRRRAASFMAAAVEFLAGAVTPVMVFAAVVDGSAFLPDLERGPLVAALAGAALVMAAVYAGVARRRPGSPLRFLVAPLVWCAVGVVGLLLHEGASAAQMALVVVAVAGSAWLVEVVPDGTVAAATRRITPFGLIASYSLVLVYGLAEEWPLWPMLVAGAAAIATLEAVRSVVPRAWISEAALVIITAAATTATLDSAWVGFGAAAMFLALAERWARSDQDDRELAVRVLAGAAVAGWFVAMGSPGALIAASGLLAVWANLRRLTPLSGVELATTVVAAFAPVGIVVGLAGVTDTPTAILFAGLAVLATSIGARLVAPQDLFYQWWVMAAAVLVAVAAASGLPIAADEFWLGAAVAMAAVATALPRIRVDLRLWVGVALAFWAWILVALAASVGADLSGAVVATAGLFLVVVGAITPGRNGGHAAAIGHVLALSTFAFGLEEWWLIGALAAWTAGWAIEVVAESRSPLQRLAGIDEFGLQVSIGQAIVLASSVPVLVAATTLQIWPAAEYLDLAWTGALLGVAYAGFAGSFTARPRLAAVAAIGSMLLTAAAVAVAFTEFDILIAADRVVQVGALTAGIVAVGLVGRYRRLWMQWYGWFLSLLLTVVVAMAFGLEESSVHWVMIGWGAAAVIGSLAVDEIRRGRRTGGTAVRDERLWPPFVLGVVAAVAGFGSGLAVPIESAWPVALVGAGLAAVVALQLRLGILSTPAWALAVYGTASILLGAGYDPAAEPWLLVPATLVLLGAAVLLPGGRDGLLRWDMPPLVVGLLLGTVTVGLGYEASATATTWVPIGAAVIMVALLRRWWALAPAGLLLLLGAAYLAGPAWFAFALAGMVVVTGVAARMTGDVYAAALQWLSAGLGAAAWFELTVAVDLTRDATLLSSAAVTALVAMAGSAVAWWRPDRERLLLWTVPWVAVAWIGFAFVSLTVVVDGATREASSVVTVVAWVWATALAVAATRLESSELRFLTVVQAFVAIGATGWSLELDAQGWVVWLTVVALVGTVMMLATHLGSAAAPWLASLATIAGGSLSAAGVVAATLLPNRVPLIVVLIGATGFSLAAGTALQDRRWFYLAPGLVFGAWAAFASEALSGNVQWFTTPLAVALLVDVELVRSDRRRRGLTPSGEELVLVELLAMGLFVGPALAQTLFVSTAYGLLGIVQGVILAVWGTASRVRRRALGGFLAAAVAALLMIAVPLADLIPQFRGPALWATIFGIGAVLIVVASTIEQTRRRLVEVRTSLESMMEGWE